MLSLIKSPHWTVRAAGLSGIYVLSPIKHHWVWASSNTSSTDPVQNHLFSPGSVLCSCFCPAAGLSPPPPPALGGQPLRVRDGPHQRLGTRSHHGSWWVSRAKVTYCCFVCLLIVWPLRHLTFMNTFWLNDAISGWSSWSESSISAEAAPFFSLFAFLEASFLYEHHFENTGMNTTHTNTFGGARSSVYGLYSVLQFVFSKILYWRFSRTGPVQVLILLWRWRYTHVCLFIWGYVACLVSVCSLNNSTPIKCSLCQSTKKGHSSRQYSIYPEKRFEVLLSVCAVMACKTRLLYAWPLQHTEDCTELPAIFTYWIRHLVCLRATAPDRNVKIGRCSAMCRVLSQTSDTWHHQIRSMINLDATEH